VICILASADAVKNGKFAPIDAFASIELLSLDELSVSMESNVARLT
jgi:hypothetical protein